jgi:hypothetical protein
MLLESLFVWFKIYLWTVHNIYLHFRRMEVMTVHEPHTRRL